MAKCQSSGLYRVPLPLPLPTLSCVFKETVNSVRIESIDKQLVPS